MLVEDVDHRQIVAAADLEVVEVVRRRDLDRARAFLGVRILVGDDRDRPLGDRQDHVLADEGLVAVVVGVNGNGGVAEHGFGPGRRDGDELSVHPFDRVLEVPQLADGLALLDLQIRNRRLELGVPVDQPLVAVDQVLLVELDEHLEHRLRQALVHGETLARPVAGRAEALQLVEDQSAGLFFPRPHAIDESLAAELAPRRTRAFQLALDDHLGRDAGMIGAGLP